MHPDANSEGLICAFHVGPKGKARPLGRVYTDSVEKWSGWRWDQIDRRAILLRRHILPQRETPGQLAAARTTLFNDFQRRPLREAADRISRLIEDLAGLREGAAVVQDETSTHLAEQMNAAMYRLSIIATILLPLSLFIGLPGINVGGIPGADSPGVVCALMLVMTGLTLWLIRRPGRR